MMLVIDLQEFVRIYFFYIDMFLQEFNTNFNTNLNQDFKVIYIKLQILATRIGSF